jgi:hypothetical protein
MSVVASSEEKGSPLKIRPWWVAHLPLKGKWVAAESEQEFAGRNLQIYKVEAETENLAVEKVVDYCGVYEGWDF